MKILFVTHTFLPKYVAGTEVYTYGLAKELSRNNEVTIFTTEPLSKFDDHKIIKTNYDNITVYCLRKNIRKNYSFEDTYDDKCSLGPFKNLLFKIKPDIIHYQHIMHLSPTLIDIGNSLKISQLITLNDFWFQTMLFNRISSDGKLIFDFSEEAAALDLAKIYIAGFFYASRIISKNKFDIGMLIKKIIYKINKRIFYYFELKKYLEKIKLRNQIMRDSLGLANLVIFPTLFLYQEFTKWGFETKKTLISSHGINTDIFTNINKTKSSILRFGFIGSIIPSKGLDILLKAWSKLPQSGIELKVYGNLNVNQKYKKQIVKLSKDCKNVKFFGTFPPNKIADIFSEIDVLILPSRWFENAPLVLRNALLSRTPVIATKLGSLIELVNEKRSGLLFENENSDDLAEKINSIIKDKKILNNFEFPKQKSVKENVAELIKIYKNFIKNKK